MKDWLWADSITVRTLNCSGTRWNMWTPKKTKKCWTDFSHKLWLMTERMGLQIQAAKEEVSQVVGISVRYYEHFSLLCCAVQFPLHVWRNQMRQLRYLERMWSSPRCWACSCWLQMNCLMYSDQFVPGVVVTARRKLEDNNWATVSSLSSPAMCYISWLLRFGGLLLLCLHLIRCSP